MDAVNKEQEICRLEKALADTEEMWRQEKRRAILAEMRVEALTAKVEP